MCAEEQAKNKVNRGVENSLHRSKRGVAEISKSRNVNAEELLCSPN